MKTKFIKFMTMASLLLICGCSQDPQKEYSELNSLRVLGIQSSVPEFLSPASVLNFDLNLIVSDVGGSGSVNVTGQACLDPGVAYGANPDCSAATGSVALTPVTFNFSDESRTEAFSMPGLSTTGPAASALAALPSYVQWNGYSVIVSLVVSRGDQTVKAFKRIVYSNKTTANSNPTLMGLTVNGSAWTSAFPGGAVSLLIQGPVAESYIYKTASAESQVLTEKMTVSWFTNAGSFDLSRTDLNQSTTWTPSLKSHAVLVAVVHDGRGGLGYQIFKY